LAGREHLAEDHLVDFFARELCPLEGGLDGNRTKIVRGQVANAPLNDPTGVLAAEAITMSVMIFLL
jgi:hypothetical protein